MDTPIRLIQHYAIPGHCAAGAQAIETDEPDCFAVGYCEEDTDDYGCPIYVLRYTHFARFTRRSEAQKLANKINDAGLFDLTYWTPSKLH